MNDDNINQDFESQKLQARFAFPTSGMTALQQIQFQMEQGKKRNPFIDIAGLWPGNETDEEFEEILRLLD